MRWAVLRRNKIPGLDKLAHIPNGGKRNLREAVRLKAEGVKPGFPDYILPVSRGRCPGIICEMKHGKGRVTPDQHDWLAHFANQGWLTFVAWDWQAAAEIIERYLANEPTGDPAAVLFYRAQ